MFLLEGSVVTNAIPSWIARMYVNKIDKSLVISPCSSQKGIDKSNCIWLGRNCAYTQRWRLLCEPFSLEQEFSALQSKKFCKLDDPDSESSLDEPLPRPPGSEELKALLVDSDRTNLLKKLSEANQKNRFLKRQLLAKEDDLVNFKKEIAVVELEIQALVNLAKEISSYSIPDGSRKINGIYIQLHLLSRLQAAQRKLEEQIKDISAAESKQVPLFWYGLAENVQVMGSFNGWTEGEGLSPEYTGTYTTFSTTLMLRPGRYEIKFLVDGDWQLSPEFPCVGEGLMQNNLLIVE